MALYNLSAITMARRQEVLILKDIMFERLGQWPLISGNDSRDNDNDVFRGRGPTLFFQDALCIKP
jgi:hypothetical protein